jgi:hypothetical protein
VKVLDQASFKTEKSYHLAQGFYYHHNKKTAALTSSMENGLSK